MNILPSLKNVEKIVESREYNVVPVSCEILSDICTPIEALRILKNVSTHCYMLESVTEKEKWGAASAMVEADVEGNDLGPILPDAYRIKLKDVSASTLDSVEQQLLEIDGVDPDIRTPSQEATILSDLEKAISTVGAVIVLILAIVSVVIIANTIKITIFSRRKEIGIMRLVGATNTFIKMPFIIEGMLIGVISALIAFGLLWVAYNYATQFVMTNPSSWLEIAIGRLIDFKQIAPYMLAGFAAGGAGLGVVGSSLFIRKHLKV